MSPPIRPILTGRVVDQGVDLNGFLIDVNDIPVLVAFYVVEDNFATVEKPS